MKIKQLFFFFIISFSPALLFVFLISPLEYFFVDAKLVISTISYQTYDISDYLAIILIDSKSEQDLSIPIEGKGWRKYDPEIITLLEQQGARVIAFDIEFSGESTRWDEILATQYRKSGNIITCEIIEGSTDPRFKDALYRIGNASVKNYFGRPRKVILFPENNRQKAFSFEVADAYVSRLGQNTAINSGLLKQRVDKAVSHKEYWINYKYPETYFPVFSYIDLLNAKNGRMGNKEKTPLSVFKNKIVLIAKDFQKDKIP
ncbi:MAG: CHASE2 domain-containing protein, partial [Spirochaetales bacterium]|nr:CHASE2 domain-containing protein [Spirochaetales bacterium]